MAPLMHSEDAITTSNSASHTVPDPDVAPRGPSAESDRNHETEPVIVSRPRRTALIPPPPETNEPLASGAVVSRDWGLGLRSAKSKESGLTRNREIAGDLPAWAPVPPGELGVRRVSRHS